MQERGRLIRRDLVEALRGITRGSPFLVRLLSSLITVASISTSHRRAAISLSLAPVRISSRVPPGVQHGDDAELADEVPWIGGDSAQCIGCGPEQHGVDGGLVVEGNLGARARQREDQIELRPPTRTRREWGT